MDDNTEVYIVLEDEAGLPTEIKGVYFKEIDALKIVEELKEKNRRREIGEKTSISVLKEIVK